MADQLDRTTGLHAIVDHQRQGTWYLIVALEDQRSIRVVALDDGAELVFGRSAEASVIIDHDAVSRRHTAVRRRGDAVLVEDLGSRNGTAINGAPIAGVRRAAAGDVIGVGPVTAIVARTSASRGRQLATIGELEDRLELEVDRALRYHRPLAIAMLRLEGPSDAVFAHVDRLLQGVRRIDLVAEYGPDELAIVLPETDAAAVPAVAQRTSATASDEVTVRFGSASFPADGNSPGALISVARERLRGARTGQTAATATTASTSSATSSATSSGALPPQTAASASPSVTARLSRRLVVIDPLMLQVFKLAERAAQAAISVLIVGETGTGKEVVAEAIHRLSPRAAAPFVRLNCAALTESLVESELFGHEKSAFTGATAMKRGIFEVAAGGTLFLDEIGELPLATQVKLLRVLEQWRIVRVGGTTELPVDVRLVCATNRDLETEVARGRFREDLFFRIAAFVIPVPPLRDRRSEILPLATQFAHEISTDLRQGPMRFTPEAMDALQHASWAGNVRELRNVIERAVVLSENGTIELAHLPEQLLERARRAPHDAFDVRQRVATVERDTVVTALDAADGNQTQAAKKLGISRFALIRLMAKHDIKRR